MSPLDKRATIRVGAALLALLLTVPAFGQDKNETPPVPAPYSRECQAANTPMFSQLPLPNVAAALRSRKAIAILTIGAPSVSVRGRRRGGYAEQIEDILGKLVEGIQINIINRGVSGELAAVAQQRIKSEVSLNGIDLVLWQVGTTDALTYVPLEELRDSILETVHWLRDRKVDLVLVGLQYVSGVAKNEHYHEVRKLIRDIAERENILLIRRYEAMRMLSTVAAGGGALVPDEFAQTEAGYACLAEYVAHAITLGAFGKELEARRQKRGDAVQDRSRH
jgi:acyl-CoA thioesterase I